MDSALIATGLAVPSTTSIFIIGSLIITLTMFLKKKAAVDENMPRLYFKESELADYVVQNCKRLSRPFHTPFWARNRHVQTVLSTVYTRTNIVRFEREHVEMADKGVVALDWGVHVAEEVRDDDPWHSSTRILIALPGLTGDAEGISFLCDQAMQSGYRPVVFNKRGHGNTRLSTPKLQSFGDPSDLREVVQHVRARYPDARLTAVGSSAGSGLLASYLGEYGSSCELVAAVCICPGYDAEKLFTKYVVQPYNFMLLRSLKKLVGRHASDLAKVIDVSHAMRSKTLLDFEERLYNGIYGYESMATYWGKNNPNRQLHQAAIPVLCINSCDDPICVKENIPYNIFLEFPKFMLVTTAHGGHCGFLESPNMEPWAEKLSVEYINTILGFMDQQKVSGKSD